MKTAYLITLIAVHMGLGTPCGHGEFSSLWMFGDGASTGTDGPGGGDYYESRYCNGRVWVELLAEWQGMSFDVADANQNNSFYGHDSFKLVTNVDAFVAPPDVGSALFAIWVNNADFVRFTLVDDPPSPPYGLGNLPVWAGLIADSIANHEAAITALYAKGVRTIVMPLAVDIGLTPFYTLPVTDEEFIRARTIEYNAALVFAMKGLEAGLPGMKIHLPDTYAFLDDVMTNPGDYGLVNPGVDAVTDLGTPALAGPGANYVFWDFLHPTAKVQMHLAALVQELISPVRISHIAPVGANIELEVVNIPIGRAGFVDGSSGMEGWEEDADIPAASATETIVLPRPAPQRNYRARFPVEWVWP